MDVVSLKDLSKILHDSGPPELKDIIRRFSGVHSFIDFRDIVRTYLPKQEDNILKPRKPSEQMKIFAEYFEEVYFPLDRYFSEEMAEDYKELLGMVPIQHEGMSSESYVEIAQGDLDISLTLMTYLIEPPYDSQGDHVAQADYLANKATPKIPMELLKKVPHYGFTRDELETIVKRSPYRALILWADYVYEDTGNAFLDTNELTYADD
jgi:hypothetical protein